MRTYTAIDMLRMSIFCKKVNLKGIELIQKYDELHPELSAKEQLQNLSNAIDEICDYCDGSGWDSHPNHSTTQSPCPNCQE